MTATEGMLPLLLTTSASLSMFVAYRSHFLQRTSRLLTILIVGSLHVAKHSVYLNEMVTQHGSVTMKHTILLICVRCRLLFFLWPCVA